MQNDMRIVLSQLRNKTEEEKNKETDKEKKELKEKELQQIDTIIDTVDNFWNNLQINAKDKIEMAAAVEDATKRTLEIINPQIENEDFTKVDKASLEFAQAVDAYVSWEKSSKSVADNKVEYNNVMMGVKKEA